MDVEKIPALPPGTEKEKIKETANDKTFKKLMKIEEPSEVELEEKKKRKLPYEKEEKITKELLKILDPKIREKMIALLNEAFKIRKMPESINLEEKKEFYPKEPSLKKEPTILKKEKIPFKKEKIFEKAPEKKKMEKPISKKEDIFHPITFEVPKNIQTTVTDKISKGEPTKLSSEIRPIFEHMVGTILSLKNSKKGVFEVQVILNNKKFENSRFYGSKIIIERYNTAPDSFNIKLTGSDEAVTIFRENIEGLYKSFEKADLDFQIGRISCEYERAKPLFKRKPSLDLKKESNL
ncbi:MAG: hypothetical protein AMS24_00250 [Chlamydiae bacterium SM23_39]|nr:MAG: hypothetical protein AMS24_00250 [Chlamydiae bacterium SM23_39]